jgi:hypothetical protein
LVQRALTAPEADPAFAGVTHWQVVNPEDVLVHPHGVTVPPPGPDLEAWYTRCAATGHGIVRMAERLHVEAGWTARVLAGRCPCGWGVKKRRAVVRGVAPHTLRRRPRRRGLTACNRPAHPLCGLPSSDAPRPHSRLAE